MRNLVFLLGMLFLLACEDNSDGIKVGKEGDNGENTGGTDSTLVVMKAGESGTPEFYFSKANYVFAGSDGAIWIGTFKEGLLKYDLETGVTERFNTKELTGDEEFGGIPYAFAEGKDGRVYVADSGGLLEWDGSQLKVHGSEFGKIGIHTINKLSDGKIYLGTYNGKLGIMNEDGVIEKSVEMPEKAGPIKDIELDASGTVWLAGRFTVASFDGSDFTIYNTEAVTGKEPQSSEDEIYMNTIAKDASGNLYFGDWEGYNKTFYWDGAEFKKGYDFNEDGVTNRIREHYFWKGDYWVAGNNGGIIRYNRGEKISEWTEENSDLPDNDVYSLDFKGDRVYFGTRNGWGYIVLDQ